MTESSVYASLSDIPRPDALISTYDARVAILRGNMSGNVSYGCGSNMREQAADIINRTERTLELLTLDIRGFRNSSIPCISLLPAEILTMIFMLVASDPDNTPHAPVETVEDLKDWDDDHNVLIVMRDVCLRKDVLTPGSLGWVKLGHVCRQWRIVLCGIPTLWARILGRLPLGDEEILMRSGEHAPLDVFAAWTPFELHEQRIMELIVLPKPRTLSGSRVLPYAERLRHICLVDLTRGGFRLSLTWLECPTFPRLDTLEIACQNPEGAGNPRLSERALEAPRLRVVRLQHCYIPWQSSMLERLSLHWLDPKVLPVSGLFDVLSQASATLQHLELHYAFRLDRAHERDPVFLPRLRTLSCSPSDTGHFSRFLDIVVLPPDVHITVEVYLEVGDDWLESDDPGDVQESYALEADIEATISAGQYDHSLDGLVISQGDTFECCPELSLYMHQGSLDLIRNSTDDTEPNPFDVDHASLTFRTVDGPDPDELDPPSFVLFEAMARFSNPTRFTTISIDMPWDVQQVSKGMSLFTELRALRIVNPLLYIDVTPPVGSHSQLPDSFPFLNGLSGHTNEADGDDHAKPRSPILDVLWLVQPEYEERYSRYSYTSWCETIALQLGVTLYDSVMATGVKPIGTLRIDYMADIRDEERNAHEIFAEIADVVKWSSREDGAEG
ncbi:hypothetical protein PENSPDRAFT_758655 [Peniophora sp. CONT]|nr:hypothetical protein PENSPDRAFT_758655 [Peniophora sp. CONT]